MITFERVSKAYAGAPAIAELSLSVERGELLALIGPSGAGKSTALRMINRLEERDSGRILVAGEDVRSVAPEALRRRIGYAIQSIGLFPHWTVAQNVATVPELLRWPRARIDERTTGLLALLGLDPAQFRDRYPHELSGGQQQRVGVARALAADPELLLMDEPFGALDPVTREALQAELARIHAASGKTIVLVTHDIDEALRLATRIALLDRGRLVQVGTPREILERPADDFVAAFVGRAEIGLRLLALDTVGARVRPGEAAPGPPIAATASLREAMSTFVARGVDRLAVVDAAGRALGAIVLADLARPRG
jgi:osmoprotectant transport system ATP-binding protein